MDPVSLHIRVLPGTYAVARPERWPDWRPSEGLFSVTRTGHEISVVCEELLVPPGVRVEKGFRALEFEGPFPFNLTGILDSVLHPLAEAKIGVFALSTYDTDYVLVKVDDIAKVVTTLTQRGHRLTGR